jgi:hypothetical protein
MSITAATFHLIRLRSNSPSFAPVAAVRTIRSPRCPYSLGRGTPLGETLSGQTLALSVHATLTEGRVKGGGCCCSWGRPKIPAVRPFPLSVALELIGWS